MTIANCAGCRTPSHTMTVTASFSKILSSNTFDVFEGLVFDQRAIMVFLVVLLLGPRLILDNRSCTSWSSTRSALVAENGVEVLQKNSRETCTKSSGPTKPNFTPTAVWNMLGNVLMKNSSMGKTKPGVVTGITSTVPFSFEAFVAQ